MVENKDNKPEGNNTNTTFEAAIARLEEIVRALESGGAPLDESLSLFEEGVSLVKLCNEKLDAAEQKVKLLTTGPDGTTSEEDFGGADK
ncbi:MAG: exodeoxyribonuclease VII small subunit [Clostridiales bacterium]|jgi:exodeoxyribonuclease VII small subunit|nr:exodeoxyribonuclease VII small subunit [Clostridiales bacterium]